MTPSPVDKFRETDAAVSVFIDFVPLVGLVIRADRAGHLPENRNIENVESQKMDFFPNQGSVQGMIRLANSFI